MAVLEPNPDRSLIDRAMPRPIAIANVIQLLTKLMTSRFVGCYYLSFFIVISLIVYTRKI